MASRKRFIDAELFQDEWFIDLEPKYKLAWIYLMTNCGHDGIWKVSQKLLSFNVGENVEIVGLKRALGDRVVELEGGRLWFIPKFIAFQYGSNLSKNNNVLKQFFEMDEKYNLLKYIDLIAPKEGLHVGAKVKVKDKYKVKDKVEVKDKDKKAIFDFDTIWDQYPDKSGKKQAKKHFNVSVKNNQDWENIIIALNNYLQSGRVKNGYIQKGSTWFNNWQDWIDPTPQMMGRLNGKVNHSGIEEWLMEKENE